ncbi:MAG: heparinase II/III family protein [Candidatus Methylacidiphilales bacterium]
MSQTLILPAHSKLLGVDTDAIRDIAGWLETSPRTFMPPASQRSVWDSLPLDRATILEDAEEAAASVLPELTDEMYLDFMKSGRREAFCIPFNERFIRMARLALGEAVEYRGRFLPELIRTLEAILEEKSWVYTMHDGPYGYHAFYGTPYVDLGVAMRSSAIAAALGWLEVPLGKALCARIRSEIRRRVVDPYLAYVYDGVGKRDWWWWVTAKTNWNSVCHGGIMYATLVAVDEPLVRARVAAAVVRHSELYLQGFTPDGYISEGLGYWNYGFGHFTLMAESLLRATKGRVDVYDLDRDKVAAVASYPLRIEIDSSAYPAFSDCALNVVPEAWILHSLTKRVELPSQTLPTVAVTVAQGLSFTDIHLSLLTQTESAKVVAAAEAADETEASDRLRSYFETAGVVVFRPRTSGEGLAVAAKGGHNDEMHNHNDVGAYTIVSQGKLIVVDPGAELYTRRTFTERRYESLVLNSYGHPVPVIDGKLQSTGPAAAAETVKAAFTDTVDEFQIDIADAYPVDGLQKAMRTFIYDRTGATSFTVRDELTASRPVSFSTALVTLGSFEQLEPNRVAVIYEGVRVVADIDTNGLLYDIQEEDLKEDLIGGGQARRYGISLKDPVTKAGITIRFTPGK